MPQRIPWNEDETLVLLDALLQVLSGTLSRKDAVDSVSQKLRAYAIHHGTAIDAVFRNQNGIRLQMSIMECAYTNGERGLKQHEVSKLFQNVVSLYKNDRGTYETRLAAAKARIDSANPVQICFFTWLAEEVPLEQTDELYTILHTTCADIERFCAQEGALKKPLFETTDLESVEHLLHTIESKIEIHFTGSQRISKLYSVLYLYYEFLKESGTESHPLITQASNDNRNIPASPAELPAQFPAELLSTAKVILSSNFVNGMRKNAIIAKKKFRKAYLDLTGNELSESIDIDELAAAVGFEYADKFYMISKENEQELQKLVIAAVNLGNRVIFYEELYQRHLDLMTKAGIFSSDMLSVILRQILPDMRYSRTYFAPTDGDTLEQDIINCFGDAPMRTYDEIKECLLYADLAQIRQVCSCSSNLVWARNETYALTDRIRFSRSDIEHSLDTISQDIESQGFSVFQRISVSESMEWNPDIPEAAVREALYIKHLAPLYVKNRSIITLPGVSLTAPMIMTEHCKNLQETTLSELQTYEEELTDKSTYSLYAAYETMIRVDRDHFVSPNAIDFNVHAIDTALSLYVQDKIIPLGSIKSFTSFPEVDGYPWNLFLLDSFCRHKSLRFRTMGGPAKSRPVGAIFPIQMRFDNYNDLLAHAVAENGRELHAGAVAEFLTQNAYTLRRIETGEIISKAQEIRLQEDITDV